MPGRSELLLHSRLHGDTLSAMRARPIPDFAIQLRRSMQGHRASQSSNDSGDFLRHTLLASDEQDDRWAVRPRALFAPSWCTAHSDVVFPGLTPSISDLCTRARHELQCLSGSAYRHDRSLCTGTCKFSPWFTVSQRNTLTTAQCGKASPELSERSVPEAGVPNVRPSIESVPAALHEARSLDMNLRSIRIVNFDVDFVTPSCLLPSRVWRYKTQRIRTHFDERGILCGFAATSTLSELCSCCR